MIKKNPPDKPSPPPEDGTSAPAAGAEVLATTGNRPPDEPRRMLTEKEVLEIVPVSTVTLWRMERDGEFPRGSYISPNRKVYFADEVVAWQNSVNGRSRGRRPRKAR
jgi:prophage regulatory protein